MHAPGIFGISRSVILGWVAFVDPAKKLARPDIMWTCNQLSGQ